MNLNHKGSVYDLDTATDAKHIESFDLNEFSSEKKLVSPQSQSIKKVLVIYIGFLKNIIHKYLSDLIFQGGSIGMKNTAYGLIYKEKLLETLVKANTYLHDTKFPLSEDISDLLITPLTSYNTRVAYKIKEFEELIDSSDINSQIYVNLCEIIDLNYEYYDGFVILQGPPTITYTASFMSFMLENLGKPVVFTGII